MEWVVRLDKDDFIGRAGLAAAGDRAPGEALVGFTMNDDDVPDDGSAELIATGRTPELIEPFGLSRFREGRLVNERAAAPAAAIH